MFQKVINYEQYNKKPPKNKLRLDHKNIFIKKTLNKQVNFFTQTFKKVFSF